MTARRRASIELTLLLLVAALSAYQVLVAPIVGVADNGDFDRVMNPVGLAHVGTSYEDRYFLWVQPRFQVVPRDRSMLVPSASLLPAGIARAIDLVLTRDRVFDLRVLGAVHLALYLVGVWLILVAARSLPGPARAATLAGVLLAAPDMAYTGYFNSFYSEPDSLILLLILVGVALSLVRAETPSRGAIVAYFACAALLSSTKVQNHVVGLPLACLPVALLACRTWRKAWTVVVPLAVGLVLLTGYLFARAPKALSYPARWNVLFYGILPTSPSPGADLAEFGLEPDLLKFIGTYGIEVDGKPVVAPYMEVGRRVGFSDIARFYLRHPDRLVRVASACASHSFERRWRIVGNYTRESGRPAGAQAPSYTGWSDLEERLFPRGLWFLVAYIGLFVVVAGWELRRGVGTAAARTAALGLTVVALALVAFGVVVTASGTVDTVRVLFLFQAAIDVSLFFSLAWVAMRCEPVLPWSARGPGPAARGPRAREAVEASRRE